MSDPIAPSATTPDPAIAACLALVADRGWFGFALRDVAVASGQDLAGLYRRYSSRTALLRAWLGTVDRALLEGAASERDESVRDRLFDIMMRRFDLLAPWRAAIRRLSQDLRRDPLSALALASSIERAMGVVLECAGLASDGTLGRLRRRALMLIEARVLPVFCDDASDDLAATMAALDRHLKIAERRLDVLQRLCRRSERGPPVERGADASTPAA